MEKFLSLIGYDRKTDYKIRILYVMILLSILVAGFFLVVYILFMPFLPAIIVQSIYILFDFSLYVSLKKKRYSYVKIAMVTAHMIQMSFPVFLWFPIDTGFNLYYIMVPMVSFLIIDYDNLKERYMGIIESLLASLLFFISAIMANDYYLYQTGENMNRFLSGMSILTILIPMTYIFNKMTRELYNNHKKLNFLASTDDLTKTMNRRMLYEEGVKAFKLSKNNDTGLTLILMDIDHFKQINDQYGHPVGDQVLMRISQLVKEFTKGQYIFSRYGGEEFALLVTNSCIEDGEKIADNLLDLIRNENFIANEFLIHITISIGVAQYSKKLHDFDHMMKVADKALYQAKNNGRDQVVSIISD